MMLELLKRLERAEPGVLVIEPGHVPDVDAILIEVIEKAAGVGALIRRPANGVLDQSGLYAVPGQLPQLLDSEPVGLWRTAGGEVEVADQDLGQAASTAFRNHRGVCAYLRARCEIRSR